MSFSWVAPRPSGGRRSRKGRRFVDCGSAPPRRVLLLAHTGREDAREVARAFCKALAAHGIVVRLLWDEANDRVLVRYKDTRTGETFSTQVPNGEALEAFRHPNAYRREALAA